ncbi:MAG: hypothetical protein ACJART_002842 [Maribacter sp.]|jgi:hypothetical protein
MVTIVDYRTYLREDGSEFHSLVVQGGAEAVKSKKTDRIYLTARTRGGASKAVSEMIPLFCV